MRRDVKTRRSPFFFFFSPLPALSFVLRPRQLQLCRSGAQKMLFFVLKGTPYPLKKPRRGVTKQPWGCEANPWRRLRCPRLKHLAAFSLREPKEKNNFFVPFYKIWNLIYNKVKGYDSKAYFNYALSSVGRTQVSKTWCRGFNSYRACFLLLKYEKLHISAPFLSLFFCCKKAKDKKQEGSAKHRAFTQLWKVPNLSAHLV